MWKRNCEKHCSDEILLAFLDGEPGHAAPKRVNAHLQLCWECRAKLQELERQAEVAARCMVAYRAANALPLAEAKQKFQQGRRAIERELAFSDRKRAAGFARRFAYAAAAISVCALGLAYWNKRSSRGPEAVRVLAASRSGEDKLRTLADPWRQAFAVEIAETKPVRQIRKSRIETWSEPARNRASSRWTGEEGVLLHASWRASGSQAFHAGRAGSAAVRRLPSQGAEALSLAGYFAAHPDLAAIEDALAGWLEQRPPGPIFLASEFEQFCSQPGTELSLRRSGSGSGGALHLEARQRSGSLSLEAVLVVERDSYRPLAQTLRLESADRSVEIRVVAERREVIPAGFDEALFENPFRTATPRVTVTAVPRKASEPALAANPDAEEIAVRYALHVLRMCLGDAVEVVREPDGSLLVRGLLPDAERASGLRTALAALGIERLRTDVRTFEEAAAAEDAVETNQPAATVRVDEGELALEEELLRHFAAGGNRVSARRRLNRFLNDATSRAERLSAEAWALEHLMERFGPRESARLPAEARRKLERMLRDHEEALREQTVETKSLLTPVLAGLMGVVGSPPSGMAHAAAGDPEAGSPLSGARRLDALVHELFAGSRLTKPEAIAAAGEALGILVRLEAALERAAAGGDAGLARR